MAPYYEPVWLLTQWLSENGWGLFSKRPLPSVKLQKDSDRHDPDLAAYMAFATKNFKPDLGFAGIMTARLPTEIWENIASLLLRPHLKPAWQARTPAVGLIARADIDREPRFSERFNEGLEHESGSTISSHFWKFRLISKLSSDIGLTILLQAIRQPDFVQYATIHLPSPSGLTLAELSTMFEKQPRLCLIPRQIKIHLLPDWALVEPLNALRGLGLTDTVARAMIEDALALLEIRIQSLVGFCDELQADTWLDSMLKSLPNLTKTCFKVDDFWILRKEPGARVEGVSRSSAMQAELQAVIVQALLSASRHVPWVEVEIDGIGSWLLQDLLDSYQEVAAGRIIGHYSKMNLKFTQRRVTPPQESTPAALTPMFPDALRSLLALTKHLEMLEIHGQSIDDDLFGNSTTFDWDNHLFDHIHMPFLRKLSIQHIFPDVTSLIDFCTRHHGTLRDVRLSTDFERWKDWQLLIVGLHRLNLEEVSLELVGDEFISYMFDQSRKIQPTLVDLYRDIQHWTGRYPWETVHDNTSSDYHSWLIQRVEAIYQEMLCAYVLHRPPMVQEALGEDLSIFEGKYESD